MMRNPNVEGKATLNKNRKTMKMRFVTTTVTGLKLGGLAASDARRRRQTDAETRISGYLE